VISDNREEATSNTGRQTGDAVTAIAVTAFGLAVWISSSSFPQPFTEDQISGSFWPRVIAGLLVGLSGILLIGALLGKNAPVDADPINPAQWPPLALTLGLLVAYALVWPVAGFLPTTFVASLLLSKILGVAKWRRAAVWSLILTLVVWGLFDYLLEVPL